MNNYEETCMELDKTLAELFGWTDVKVDDHFNGVSGVNESGFFAARRAWTQDDQSAFSLMVEYNCYPCKWDDESIACGRDVSVETICKYPSESACVRVAIVRAVIAKLSKNV